MWYVEEQDLLALALRGRYVWHAADLKCGFGDGGSGDWGSSHAAARAQAAAASESVVRDAGAFGGHAQDDDLHGVGGKGH
jgi:hypothetical protein